MRLSLEIPKVHMDEFSTICDLDFALAQEVLADKDYAGFYLSQSRRGRRVIMDNGFHENGESLPVEQLLAAAEMINPSVIVAPDRLGDAEYTQNGFLELKRNPKCHWPVGLVLQGKTMFDRVSLFMNNRGMVDTLLLPYREPRYDWLLELAGKIPHTVQWPPFMHLLGVSSLDELLAMGHLIERCGIPRDRVSIDTGKPFKLAMAGVVWTKSTEARHMGKLDLGKAMTLDETSLAYRNIAFLRRFMG